MYSCRYIVRFEDVDAAGIVYYPRFFYYCHNAFEDLFNERAPMSYHSLINERNIGFPTVHVEADFLKPLFHGDEVEIRFSLKSIKTSSLIYEFVFYKIKNQEQCFKALITLVCMQIKEKRSIPVPDDLREFLNAQ